MAIRNFTNLSAPPPFLRSSPPPQFAYILTAAPSLRLHSLSTAFSPPRRRRVSSVAFAYNDGIPPGDGGGGVGGGGGGHGDGEEDRERNKAEAIVVLAEGGRSVESLPKDLAAAIESGRVPAVIVERFLELEKSAVWRWLLQFGGFKERLLADDLFMAKVAMECGVGIFTKTAAELEKRKENFSKELDFVCADVIMAIIADFMLVWLPAPTVSLKPPLAISAGPLAKFFYGCPENAFQVALAGTSYSFLQRVGAVVRNGAKLFGVGTTASLVGTGVTNALINMRKMVDKSYAVEAEDLPVVATSIAYGVYMAVSSNLRYQVLAGVIEQRILEPLLHKQKLALSAICFVIRTGNTFLGSLMWVDYARWIGIQRSRA
ncbi:protein RETICULATA-RELATED 4, chloroplastic-like [Momordica charantia]|uniref:Protein RETICULATA-RELATED 4, chloroplastic-like n=1 Tax=Momordica charantia TaxID=3673 RepID=A0A6J1DF73_MOMCH|nr:protein RETICULATA-RELATED 4, chloroplastic-like [Momordica charantia]